MWVLLALAVCTPAEPVHHFDVAATRDFRVAELPVDLEIVAKNAEGDTIESFGCPVMVAGLGQDPTQKTQTAPLSKGRIKVRHERAERPVQVEFDHAVGSWQPSLRSLPGWLSILPPLLAILLAVWLRDALIALFGGIYLGALFVYGYNPLTAFLRTVDTHLVAQVANEDHAFVLIMTLALGGMAAVMSKSGASRAMVEKLAERARTRRSGMLSTWISGLIIFFDDYTNCLLVGNTVRPLTDQLKVSREKLSFIVDATAAPIATVALVSAWIGYQLEQLKGVLETVGSQQEPYDLFLDILPYSFYSLVTIAFVFFIIWTGRDYGPMLKAEQRAARGDGVLGPGAQPLMSTEGSELTPSDGVRSHWLAGVAPVLTVLLVVAVGLYIDGSRGLDEDAGLRQIIANANSYAVLVWAAFFGSLVAIVGAAVTESISFTRAVEAWVVGVRAMMIAVLILVLAWGIGSICKDYLQTGPWMMSVFDASGRILPTLTFLACGLIAFATGSSYSTMAIVIPIAGPMAWAVTGDGSGFDPATVDSIRHATLAAVLSGSVFGDHCSPISDTTVMSSVSTACDHVEHVRTQAPYAATCATAACLFGFLPAGFGMSPWLSLALGAAACFAVVRFAGTRT